jgi:hypothetical protein
MCHYAEVPSLLRDSAAQPGVIALQTWRIEGVAFPVLMALGRQHLTGMLVRMRHEIRTINYLAQKVKRKGKEEFLNLSKSNTHCHLWGLTATMIIATSKSIVALLLGYWICEKLYIQNSSEYDQLS